jgi:hypothetical protein
MTQQQDLDLEGARFRIGSEVFRPIPTGLVFRTTFGDSEVDLTLFRIGKDLVPAFFLRDVEVTRQWIDYCLREKLHAWDVPEQAIDFQIRTAGEVLTEEEAKQ